MLQGRLALSRNGKGRWEKSLRLRYMSKLSLLCRVLESCGLLFWHADAPSSNGISESILFI